MTVSIWQQAHQKRETAYDVIVVGGGIVGCSTAYWLGRRAPSLDVALLEARTLGAEASGRNAGFVLQGTHADHRTDIDRYGKRTARRLWQFTRENRDLLAAELRGPAFSWQADGALVAAGTAEEEERLRASLPSLRAAGAPVVHLDAEETNERIGASGFHGSLFVTTGAAVNPLHLVQHVAAESGADVHTQHPVDRVRWRGSEAVLETPDRHFRTPKVVFALGPALPELVPEASSVVRSVRAQMLATAPAAAARIPVPVYSHRGGFYVRQRDDRRVLVGGGRHAHRGAEETSRDATTPAVQATIERYLHTQFPWSQSLGIEQRWSGTMGFSPDGRPVVGRVPEHPESVFATGFTGHGMGYGFRMGRLLADLMWENKEPEAFDLFAASRFEDPDTERAEAAPDRSRSTDS